ncbi:MAG: hypothetical protein ACRENQ_04075 [Gemmatimonadaceae bacterium]
MTGPINPSSNAAWQAIDQSKQFDRFVRRACIGAWTAAFIAVLVYAVLVVAQVVQMARMASVGVVGNLMTLAAATPLIFVVGVISLLIATLTTVGIFMRQRTASLAEIQLRLAALEDMLGNEGNAS